MNDWKSHETNRRAHARHCRIYLRKSQLSLKLVWCLGDEEATTIGCQSCLPSFIGICWWTLWHFFAKAGRQSDREIPHARTTQSSKRSSGVSQASRRSSISRSKTKSAMGLSHLMAGSFEERRCYLANYIETPGICIRSFWFSFAFTYWSHGSKTSLCDPSETKTLGPQMMAPIGVKIWPSAHWARNVTAVLVLMNSITMVMQLEFEGRLTGYQLGFGVLPEAWVYMKYPHTWPEVSESVATNCVLSRMSFCLGGCGLHCLLKTSMVLQDWLEFG